MTNEVKFESKLRDFAEKCDCLFIDDRDEFTLEVNANKLIPILSSLRDEYDFRFDQLIDVAGVDYLEFGKTEWKTQQATGSGFSRGVRQETFGRFKFDDNPISQDMAGQRYAVVYHLQSVVNNRRVRVKVYCDDNEFPVVPSVCSLWAVANWYEREAFDLYGIVFEGHPDLRRILTDYGFVGHPLRKDFPLVGHVEVRFDPSKQRVVYEPVSIDPRVLVPKVIRDDNRYQVDKEES